MKAARGLVIATALLGAGATLAEPVVEMEGTAIIGEQEQPKVRFSIPWQQIPPAPRGARPWVSQVKERPAPLAREAFRQLLRFKQARPAAPAPSPAGAGQGGAVRVIIRP